MLKNEKILVFAAHPDDEGSVWATLYKYFENGAIISIVWMTNGDKTVAPVGKFVHFLIPLIKSIYSKSTRKELSQRIAVIRKDEALKVANIINAKPTFLEYKDTKVPNIKNNEAILKITELIRKIKPTIILTHWFREMHPDHKNTSALILKSFFLSNDANFITKYTPHKVRILGFWDERGKGYKPNFHLNVTNQIKRIKEWGKIYKSQAFRIVGRFAKFKARKNSKNTPYNYVEAFKIIGVNKFPKYGEFFP
ncbi:MAG: PIG-L family deacetylase [Candidatus Helarchaeota archaeon]|nr:PIG-L family deacetylase [Candidatus Helarchaeota archaeon]